ncbi:MAG: CerR family C-terminal domain-containing protein [Rhizobiaceae bacterium]
MADVQREGTRDALVRAAMRLFGAKGVEGTSTREIADAAGTNIASIAYHFGGKAGLHRACGEAVAEILIKATRLAASTEPAASGPQALQRQLSAILSSMAGFLFSTDQSGLIVPFILREMAQPGAAFEAIYTGVMEPVHGRLCRLWGAATGEDAESAWVKLTVFSLIGQLLYFRIGEPAIARRLGVTRLGAEEVDAIRRVIEANIAARLATHKGVKP